MSVWQQYVAVITDPGHTLAEITFTLVVDIIILGMMYPLAKRWLAKRFKQRDQEHGHILQQVNGGDHSYVHVPDSCPMCAGNDCLIPVPRWDNVFECVLCANKFVFKSWEYKGE